jgi:NAD(P)-dependent dehydrogenase (short-subunit alcohol dehydrogenase family)
MNYSESIALVSGANRGIGKAVVMALLARGAKRIYACARKTHALDDMIKAGQGRIVPLQLDITDPAQVAAAAKSASDVTLLINNAGSAVFGDILGSAPETVAADMNTNYFGTLSMIRAFAPVIEANGGGDIANVLSIVSLAAMPGLGGYSASKAAAGSMTQAVRGSLQSRGIRVHGIYPGPVDTDMAKDFNAPKASPGDVAEIILDGIAANLDEIFPDDMAKAVGDTWRTDPKQLERNFSAY